VSRRRVTDALTALAARSFPRSRRADGRVVRDCAREAIDASGPRVLAREGPALVGAGLRARAGVAATELSQAPWRDALAALTLPLAAAMLTLWTFGFVPRYDHWPLGVGWVLLLGGSLVAVIAAALRWRWLTAIGAAVTFVTAASPYAGLGGGVVRADTPSFFYGYGVDLGAASLLPTLLLVAAALSLPRSAARPIRLVAGARLALGLLPATVAVLGLLPAPEREPTYMHLYRPGHEPTVIAGSADPWPWIAPSRTFLVIFGIALAAAMIVTWTRARIHPAAALASGLVLVSVAYPLVWVSIQYVPVPYWVYNGPHPWLLAILPLLLAVTLMRRAGRMQHG